MQHVSDQQYRRPGSGSLTRYSDRVRAIFTGWRRLCLLTVLLCGVATLAAADTHESRVTPAPVLGDLNGDGRDDVLLRHTDGRWFYYPMDGRNHITDQRGYADLTRNLDWQFAGIGDLNGDGRDDVLMRHTDGRWWYYPMDGRRHITAERGLAGLTRNLDWHVAGIGDLNGDGKDDVLLRNKNGRWYYYPMNGRRYLTDERGYADLTRDLDWHVAGIGDLNGDGKDDVLLRHTDGRWDYYPMDGRNPIADQRGLAGLTRNLAWRVAGMGDLNGDGKDDVLLRHTDSRWYYYPMDGRRFLTDERGYAGLTRNLAWQVAGIGDLNGDGRDDVLLRHTDSRWYYYPMDGRNYLADERGYANLTRNADWSIADTDTLAPEDTAPSFGTAGVADQNYVTGAAIDALTLPAAGGGNGALTYSLTPDVLGLSFDAATLRLTGTPTSAGTYNMTYMVEDADGDTDTHNFTITVEDTTLPLLVISGTLFVDLDIVTPSDPTTFRAVAYAGRGNRLMFDRRQDRFVTYNAFLFDAAFTDGFSLEIQVNPEFQTFDAARQEAEKYGWLIGQLPRALRQPDFQTVWIHRGVELFGGRNNNVLIHTGQADLYEAEGILEEALIHEGAHTSLDSHHASSPGWVQAQQDDMDFISTYARDHPTREDIAESFPMWMALRYRADKISPRLAATIRARIPHRLDYLDAQHFDMAPVR